MRFHTTGWLLGICLVGSTSLLGQQSPIIPEKVWRALANELSGDMAFDHIRQLTQYHSPNAASEGFQLSAQWVASRARELGLEDVKMLSLEEPTRGWTVRAGEAWVLAPFELKLGDVRATPLRVADNSHTTDVTAELLDVGEGTSDADYEGREVKGKVVLASGSPSAVHERAVWEHEAAGVIVYGSRRRSHPDQLPWQRIPEKSASGEPSAFAWILTIREGERLRAELQRAEADGRSVKVRVQIEAEFGESNEGILEGWIRGTVPDLPSIVLIAHLQEERTSANDNRSGCANLLEIGRALTELIREGKLVRPRRNIRFWWVDEIRAPYQYFAENPGERGRILAALNQDMVGAKLSLGPRMVVMSRTPFSLPSFLNDVAESVLEAVRLGNTALPFTRGNVDEGEFSRPLVSVLGTREPFYAGAFPFYNGSDHIAFVDGRVGIPAISLNNWPDPYIHSTDDDLWQVDPTQLKRNAFIIAATGYFLASAGETEMGPLAALLMGGAQKRLAGDSAAALCRLEDESIQDVASRYRDAAMLMDVATERELAAIESSFVLTSPESNGRELLTVVRERVQELARALRDDMDKVYEQRTGKAARVELTVEEEAAAKQVPEWSVPLGESLVRLREAAGVQGLHPFYAMEVRYLIDGNRTVLDIYRTVRAESLSAGEWYYGPVELGKVIEVLESAEKAGAVRFGTER